MGCITINYNEYNVVEALRDLFPQGPDVVIDAVGFRFPKSFTQRLLYGTSVLLHSHEKEKKGVNYFFPFLVGK